MDIRTVLDELVTIEAALTITSPIAASIKRAYKYPPSRNADLETPCIINNWSMPDSAGMGGLRVQNYTVHGQLFINDADIDRGCDIATAFWGKLVDALGQNVTLGGTATRASLRGASPDTVVLLPWNEKPYQGLDFFIDVLLKDTFAYVA